MSYSFVIPCYCSSHTIREVVETTIQEMEQIGRTPYEFVLVDDHSPDDGATLRELKALADDYPCVKAIELAKNSGQHNASMAGLNYAKGDYIISMDDDLQTRPSQLPKLFAEIEKGYDVVYGYYPEKKHSKFRNFGSWVHYESIRILIGKPKGMKTSSFFVMRKFVRDYMIQYKEPYTHLQGLVLRTTRNISSVPVEHFDRAYGQSGYTFKKLLKLWFNIVGYSVVPLRMATGLGATFSLVGFIAAIVVIVKKILHPATMMGWSSIMAAIFFFSGLILLSLGLIGEYIGRMFLGMGNNPQFVVKEIYTQTEDSGVDFNELGRQ
ncbi:MAG: glycosyltransferase family 2 protein [Eubacteriales bacterium]|nr:glycosyltransferase family 2 protein [Eubacteriales bacterium]